MTYLRRKKPEGYKELLVYKRADELQSFIYEITENFPMFEEYHSSLASAKASANERRRRASGP